MKEAFGFTRRLLNRDFSGYAGLAVKNSIFSFLTSAVGKIGSLLFTAVLVGSSFLSKLASLFSIELKPLLTQGISWILFHVICPNCFQKYQCHSGLISYLTAP